MEMMEMLPLTCRMQMEECGQGLVEACMEGTENMSCSDCSATFAENGGCEMVMSGPSDDDDDMGAKMMEMLPLTCRMQMGKCGQGLYEACLEGTENMSCSDCSATFAEKGGCDMVMSGPSDDDDDFGAKMMEMLPLTCRMQMGECGQGLYEACLEDMSCSDCSATFADKGGCEVMMSGLSADDMSAKMMEMMEMLPLTCRMQMGECGQGLFEACMEGTENMSCSDCSVTFAEKGGC